MAAGAVLPGEALWAEAGGLLLNLGEVSASCLRRCSKDLLAAIKGFGIREPPGGETPGRQEVV